MKITTGKAPLSFMTVAAILSLSLVVNLPGLAITPMLETIKKIFPDSTELEAQLLTTLPNVLIIPFVLLSGKFSLSRHRISIVVGGLIIYALCAVGYLLSNSMAELIIISCVLGAGAGILVPFSTGLIADTFSGVYKMKEMGVQSGLANMTLVAATFVVGWLQNGNWHLPFIVYLVTLIPLVLTPWLKKIPTADSAKISDDNSNVAAIDEVVNFRKNGFSYSRTIGIFMVYLTITCLSIVISYYAPFLVNKYGWDESLTGTLTALYFLFIFLPGFFLSPILKVFRKNASIFCVAFIIIGLAMFSFTRSPWTFCLGAICCGFGYGVLQPVIYDKATRIVNQPRKATLALSIILSANYLAIVIAPFIIDGVGGIFKLNNSGTYPFIFNLILSAIFLAIVIIYRKSFALSIPSYYYEKKEVTEKKEVAPADK